MPFDPYVYPGTEVLRNRFDLRDGEGLARREAILTEARLAELAHRPLSGKYDLDHLRATHRHIFGDVYPWAGEIRTVQITKGGDLFAMPQHVEPYLYDVLAKLPEENYLRGTDRDEFVGRLADYYADINATHPFREGNGRTQRAFLSQLAEDADYHVAWNHLDAERNNEASRAANHGDTGPIRDLLSDITFVRSAERVDEKAREGERARDDARNHVTRERDDESGRAR